MEILRVLDPPRTSDESWDATEVRSCLTSLTGPSCESAKQDRLHHAHEEPFLASPLPGVTRTLAGLVAEH
jgi:hypothetical protein